jgi:hypothetical protein
MRGLLQLASFGHHFKVSLLTLDTWAIFSDMGGKPGGYGLFSPRQLQTQLPLARFQRSGWGNPPSGSSPDRRRQLDSPPRCLRALVSQTSDSSRSHRRSSWRAIISESFAASTGSRHRAERRATLSQSEAPGSGKTSAFTLPLSAIRFFLTASIAGTCHSPGNSRHLPAAMPSPPASLCRPRPEPPCRTAASSGRQ